ncbi:aldehyde dehydrogenase (NAD+) [Cyclonatronum proteinivorum]|uniref:Aldehyde dehydrogenase n=1 Tax=Cyclonatronum proteinivorum TaxID=1457365 RepID=A0A345UIW7_9BACT|nr:aldehyde dehydrogenase family protein [Cyclonatronum proteinivorum]AXJ00419.1 aldehyde dehydrogenase (NAD+) [Cyclonatronum proteinivorum]
MNLHNLQETDVRIQLLNRLKERIIAAKSNVAEALMADLGKPSEEAEVTEIIPVISELRHIVKNLQSWVLPKKVNKSLLHLTADSYILYKPKGNVLILSPWNYPFNLVISPLAYAISAGNRVTIKPSEFTKNTNRVLKQIVSACLPSEICSFVEGDAAVAAELTSQPWDHIFFTGSPAVGKKVMMAAAQNLVPVTLELGGKSPCIVTENADLEKAARRVAWGKFTNCGQTCIAPDYLLVHKNIYDTFLGLLKSELQTLYPQACLGRQDDSGYGRIIHQSHFLRLKELLDEATDKGAKHLLPYFFDADDKFMSPVVLELNQKHDSLRLMEEEIFGPLLPVFSWQNDDDITPFLKRHSKPLAAYIFSRSSKEARFWRNRINTGGFVINDVLSHFAHNNLPFGGNGSSGHGRSHGFFGFREFSIEMAVLESGPGPSGAELVGPPYTDLKRKIINTALKLV